MVSLQVANEVAENINKYESKYDSRNYRQTLSSSIILFFPYILFFNKVYAFGLITVSHLKFSLILAATSCVYDFISLGCMAPT